MYGFLIKKSFCDDWDNLLSVVVVNLVSLFSILLLFMGCSAIVNIIDDGAGELIHFIVLAGTLFIVTFVLNVFSMAWGELAAEIANFNGIRLVDFFKKIPGVLKDALLFTLLTTAIIIVSIYCFEFYFFQMQSLVGFFIGAFIFWLDIVAILTLQWFIPIRSLMHNNFKKCLKKCLIIFFDNTGFSILVFIHTIVVLILSVILIGLFPGISGILVNTINALRLRLYKYDYLEEHPELQTKAERRKIPWDELIFDDKEALGPRKLKSFLFPWKE